MNFGHNKTKLTYILELGLSRIDAAVESVIDRYPTPVIEKPDPVLVDLSAKGVLRSGAEIRALYSPHPLPSLLAAQAASMQSPLSIQLGTMQPVLNAFSGVL